MFETNWQKFPKEYPLEKPTKYESRLQIKNIKRILVLFWSEHCVECTAPLCYKNCVFYKKRLDSNCARFIYGIYQNRHFNGFFDFGADICFRKWGKLEVDLNKLSFKSSIKNHILVQKIFDLFTAFQKSIFYLLNRIVSIKDFFYNLSRCNSKIEKLIQLILMRRFIKRGENYLSDNFDDFIIECYSPSKKSFKLILEQETNKKVMFRKSLFINPGYNFFIIPANEFKSDYNTLYQTIKIYPEDTSSEIRLIFTWLDFVKYKKDMKNIEKETNKIHKTNDKIKCIIWDLDNTLWKGIISEDKESEIKLNKNVLNTIKNLDKRGIIQSIISKNNFENAWKIIKKLKIDHYFVYPQINWKRKSENMNNLSKRLNIGSEFFAFIDDSPFERAEVKDSLPKLRVYDISEIDKLLDYPEFNVPISEESKKRRLSYLAQEKREKVMGSCSKDYISFLKSCEMVIKIFIPSKEKDIQRCWELIQRSNQLNLSARRYSIKQLNDLLLKECNLCLAITCKDKFGDYGIIGFVNILKQENSLIINDFVISCRAAKKHIEHAFFEWLSQKGREKGKKNIIVYPIKTEKNQPLFDVLSEMPFIVENNPKLKMTLDLSKLKKKEGIIKAIDKTDFEKHTR